VWTTPRAVGEPVDNTSFSPNCAHSSFRLPQAFRSIIPGVHTLYDYV
jgi:hypothetical protein